MYFEELQYPNASENSAVIFLLHEANAGNSQNKEKCQNNDGDQRDGFGFIQEGYCSAEKGRKYDDKKRFPKGFSVSFMVADLGLMIIVDQIGSSFVYGYAKTDQKNGDGKHNERVDEHGLPP